MLFPQSFLIQPSVANQEAILTCQGKSRTRIHSCELCTQSHWRKRQVASFHASSIPGATRVHLRETAFAAFLIAAVTHRSPHRSWSSAKQLTALAPPGLSQCKTASGQHAQKVNPINLKQNKAAEILVNLATLFPVQLHMRFTRLLNSTLQLMPRTRQQLLFSQWRLETVSLNCRWLISMKSKQDMSGNPCKATCHDQPWSAELASHFTD